ncbi:MAG: hypothetical protein AAF730_14965 [Bacteroidota bacterium]
MNDDVYQFYRLCKRQRLTAAEGDLFLDLLDAHQHVPLATSCLSFWRTEAQRMYRQGPGKRTALLRAMQDRSSEEVKRLAENLMASADEEVMFGVVKDDTITYVVYTDTSLTALHGITQHSDNDGGSTGFGVTWGNDGPSPTSTQRSAARQMPHGPLLGQ